MIPRKLSTGQLVFLVLGVAVWTVVALTVTPFGAGLVTLLVLPYFAPTLFAAFATRKKKLGLIAVCNLLWGWTGIGWIICLIWSWTPDKSKEWRDRDIWWAARAAESGIPEDQEVLNWQVKQYKTDFGELPNAIREQRAIKQQRRFTASMLQKITPQGTRGCPFCAEMVEKKARVCNHCGKDIPPYRPFATSK